MFLRCQAKNIANTVNLFYTEMMQVFSGMIIECEIMGSRGLVPLRGVLKGGGAAPFFLLRSNAIALTPLDFDESEVIQ